MLSLTATQAETDLAVAFCQSDDQDQAVRIWWLGQAGFALKYQTTLLLVDPYLSDSLAEKYRNKKLKHQRLMPVPVDPEKIRNCAWYLCTHSHTDHMDPLTLQAVNRASAPHFLVPRADLARALRRGVPSHKLFALTAGESLALTGEITVEAVAAAHEQLEIDEHGNFKYLGYILSLGGLRLYHSGDTIPYPGLTETLASKQIDIAMLPINGRDPFRRSHGVPGNFTLEEAITLCHDTGIPYLVGHHFEMFDFNTINRCTAETILQQRAGALNWLLPEVGLTYTILTEDAQP